jgi:hypothetical protein
MMASNLHNVVVVFRVGRYEQSIVFMAEDMEDLKEQVNAWVAYHPDSVPSRLNFYN